MTSSGSRTWSRTVSGLRSSAEGSGPGDARSCGFANAARAETRTMADPDLIDCWPKRNSGGVASGTPIGKVCGVGGATGAIPSPRPELSINLAGRNSRTLPRADETAPTGHSPKTKRPLGNRHRPRRRLPVLDQARDGLIRASWQPPAIRGHGAYQIGEVYARSWVTTRTSSGRSPTPKCLAS